VNAWYLLAGAILAEVCGTLALRASDGFSRVLPSAIVVVGYGTSFFLLSRCLKAGMRLGTAYAVWSSLGIVLIATAGRFLFDDPVTTRMMFGIGFIIVGVVLVQGAH
jgi:small multidrug resistance pump